MFTNRPEIDVLLSFFFVARCNCKIWCTITHILFEYQSRVALVKRLIKRETNPPVEGLFELATGAQTRP